MRYCIIFTCIFLCLLTVGCGGGSSSALQPTPVTPSSALYLYVATSPVSAYRMDSSGALTPLNNLPVAFSAVSLASASGYLFASTSNGLETMAVSNDGSVRSISTVTLASIEYASHLSTDQASKHVYLNVGWKASADPLPNTPRPLVVYNLGTDGSLQQTLRMDGFGFYPPVFSTDNKLAFAPGVCSIGTPDVQAFRVAGDGSLSEYVSNANLTPNQPDHPCAYSVALSPDGAFLAYVGTGTYDPATLTQSGVLGIYSVNADGTLTPLQGSPYTLPLSADDIQFDATGKYLLVAQEDGLALYDFNGAGAPTLRNKVLSEPISRVILDPAGKQVLATGSQLYVTQINAQGLTEPKPYALNSVTYFGFRPGMTFVQK